MSFNSIHFLVFLPVVFALHWLLPQRWRWMLLLIASYYFYMSWNPWFGILLFGTSVIDWFAALKIEEANERRAKKGWLLLSVLSNLGCLAAFKYSAFLFNTFEWTRALASGNPPQFIEAFVIPAGLSFYTFQSLSYTIDVFRGQAKAERNPAMFCLYVSFFPQLVAGPVERYNHLAPQFRAPKFLSQEAFISGVRIMTWGFFKKIAIADRLADFVNPVFHHPQDFNGLTFLIIGFFFAVQVYADFSGYSDIATGVAKLFGYELSLNWKRPLLARSLHDFWSRHHITMTTWFRDYIYISLGGNPSHATKDEEEKRQLRMRWFRNLFFTFLLSGLWHGARWTYVIWGATHGLIYILEILLKVRVRPFNRLMWIYFILFHSVTLLMFRAESMQDFRLIYSKLFHFNWSIHAAFTELRNLNDLFPLLLTVALIVFLFLKDLSEEHHWFKQTPAYFRIWRPAFYIFIFVALFAIGEFRTNPFIYFHF